MPTRCKNRTDLGLAETLTAQSLKSSAEYRRLYRVLGPAVKECEEKLELYVMGNFCQAYHPRMQRMVMRSVAETPQCVSSELKNWLFGKCFPP